MDGSIVFATLRQCAPASNNASLDPPESISQTHRSVQPFSTAHGRCQEVPILYNGPPLSLKIALANGGYGLQSSTCFLGFTPLSLLNGISIGSSGKSLYLSNDSVDLQEIWHGDAFWPSLFHRQYKISIVFLKSKLADGRHFGKPLNRHNLATVWRIAMKFGKMTHFDPLKPDWIFKSPRLKATQQRTALVRCRCRFVCTR